MDKSLDSEAATINVGRLLAPALDAAGVIFLSGGLGAGKTTLCRGLLRGCLLYTSPSPRDRTRSRMPSSA